MSQTLNPVKFFDPKITIIPHSSTNKNLIGKPITLEKFANGQPIRLNMVVETNDYLCEKGRYPNNQWIEGPEV